jgi:hypothetical protein
MLDDEWDEDAEPGLLIRRGVKSLRKKRLVAAACARRVLHLIPDPAFERVLCEAARYADGLIGWPAVLAARKAFRAARKPLAAGRPPESVARALEAVRRVTEWDSIVVTGALEEASRAVGARAAEDGADEERAERAEKEAQFTLMVDVAARAGRRVAPAWRTEAVVGLARGMYEGGDFAAMPVLADALEDAGCADGEILVHCRGEGPHVKGCWVVDLILGKK